MNISNRFKAAFQSFTKTNNSIDEQRVLARQFLKYGNQKPLVQDWSKVIMTDQELYSGYSYAAINVRANKLAQLAAESLKTKMTESYEIKLKIEDDEFKHPYLGIIDKSPTFTNYKFWYDISTYIDLSGNYYLMAVRNVQYKPDGTLGRVGDIQSFKLISPYNIKRVINEDTGEVGGYIEYKNGLVREISKDMIIPIQKLNPFNNEEPYAMTDAAKEYQYTLKQAGDYTRHSLKNNMAAPGIITTDVLLPDEQFINFRNRIINQEKGLPLFGNGAGAISWDSMQVNLDNASLENITEINRATLFAVSGVGKTIMGIEESGTTRETAKTQKDMFIENHVEPQLQLIIDALNQDYKNYYKKEYEEKGLTLYINSPLKVDKETELKDKELELKDIDIRKNNFDLYNSLVNEGYTTETAALYVNGEIELSELKIDTTKPIETPVDTKEEVKDTEVVDKKEDTQEESPPAENKIIEKTIIINNKIEKDDTKGSEVVTNVDDSNAEVEINSLLHKYGAAFKNKFEEPLLAYYIDNSFIKGIVTKKKYNTLELPKDVESFNTEEHSAKLNELLKDKTITLNNYTMLSNDYDYIQENINGSTLEYDNLNTIVRLSGYAKQIKNSNDVTIDKDSRIKINSAEIKTTDDNKFYVEVNAIIISGNYEAVSNN